MKKRLFSIALFAIVLLIFVMPTMVVVKGETHDSIDFEEWNETNSLPTTTGSYVLNNDITLPATWNINTGSSDNPTVIDLCLNGHIIKLELEEGVFQSVIQISSYVTLNLYDHDVTTKHYFNKDNTTGLWTLAEDQTVPTDYVITGGCITGGNVSSGAGIYINGGTLNMFGGNIVGNMASSNGGGVSNSLGNFTMSGGSIVGNVANNGGGLYTSFLAINIITGGVITDNTATVGAGIYAKEEECLAAGTLITMADGTQKPIETLNIGDEVRVFDHETGEIATSKLFDVWPYPEKHSGAFTLHFTNDVNITIVGGHSFFNREENKYVPVTKDNVNYYVGQEFYNVDQKRYETLLSYEFLEGEYDTYVITSEEQLNCVTNGLLSNEDGFYTILTNIFEFDENLKIDADKKAKDIEKYGLWGYENLKYATKEVYDILNLQYLSVAFGKGMLTQEAFDVLESYWTGVDPELFTDTETETKKLVHKKNNNIITLGTTEVEPPTSFGIYLGGSIKIQNNNTDNLYLCAGKTITIGTGTQTGGNGVVAPTNEMIVGIKLANKTGQFTSNGTKDDIKYFTLDDSCCIVYNNEGYLDALAAYKVILECNDDNLGSAEASTYFTTEGTLVTLTATPIFGYYVTWESTDVDLTTESFEMPANDVTINAVFKKYEVKEISIKNNPTKTEYFVGENIDVTGAKIIVKFANDSTGEIDVTSDMISGYDATKAKEQTITVTYENKTCTFTVNVKAIMLEQIGVKNNPTKVNYNIGEELDVTGAKLLLTYNNASTSEVDVTTEMISGYDATKVGEQTITVTYEGKTCTFTVKVTEESNPNPTPGNPKTGLIIALVICCLFILLCLIIYIVMFIVWKKKDKALKFLIPSFEKLDKLFTK